MFAKLLIGGIALCVVGVVGLMVFFNIDMLPHISGIPDSEPKFEAKEGKLTITDSDLLDTPD